MTALALRRGRVVSVERAGSAAEVTVEVAGNRRPAVAFERLTGSIAAGDEVIVNTQAADLGLGSGGFDVVHVNLTRGLEAAGEPGAHVMKLNYSSLQHAVIPVEERNPDLAVAPAAAPLAVIALHGQLAPVAWAASGRHPRARIGFIQTAGGALPGALSRVVRELRERGLLAGHITAAASFGGEYEAITVPGALSAAFATLGWDAAIAGPGPGIVGSGTALGHGGIAALETAHSALALGLRCILVPRMSSADPRPRHHGLSHHTETVLSLLLRPVLVALPSAEMEGLAAGHESRVGAADLDGFVGTGLPARSMGRGPAQDPLFFRAALAGGSVLGEQIAMRAERVDGDRRTEEIDDI